jgi:nickel-dependent lactate racemase
MNRTFSLPYGKTSRNFGISESNCLGSLDLPELPGVLDVEKAILHALGNPIRHSPLTEWIRGARKVVVTCPDITREAQARIYLPVLFGELNRAGISDDQIELCFALGTHRELSHEEMEGIAGASILKRVEFFQSRGNVKEDFRLIGSTAKGTPLWFNTRVLAADRIISTGAVVFHNFAGFGGGRKGLLPGIAQRESVMTNHRLMLLPQEGAGLNPHCTTGILEGNPIHEDMLDAAMHVSNVFLLNTVLNVQKEIAGVFAGDLWQAHEAGVSLVRRWFGVPIRQRADFVIFSPGGFPRDISFYQGFRSLGHAARAVRPGGVIVLVAEFGEGAGGADKFRRWFELPDQLSVEREMRRDFDIVGQVAWDMHQFAKTIRIIAVTAMSKQETRMSLMEPAPSIEEALDRVFRLLGPGAKGYVMPQGFFTVPLETQL